MGSKIYSVIKGTGSYIPAERVPNEHFLKNDFYDSEGKKLGKANEIIVEKFREITTIEERRYASKDFVTSDIATFAAQAALKSAGIDKEELGHIIVAHNFGDVRHDNNRTDIVPSIASRVKHKLEIKNPEAVAYDVTFGCPGWLQGVIQADYYIKAGDAKYVLVIGAEALSRVSDPHDRDSMLYSDGAGAVVLEAVESDVQTGILAHKSRSDAFMNANLLHMGKSYNQENNNLYLKMNGRKLYQYALETVPKAIKECLEKSGTHLSEIEHILIHQANGKMDSAILQRLFCLYGIDEIPENIMPMTIDWLGNSSVATLPTLLDLMVRKELKGHAYDLRSGQKLVFASVGAGMNINAFVYKVP